MRGNAWSCQPMTWPDPFAVPDARPCTWPGTLVDASTPIAAVPASDRTAPHAGRGAARALPPTRLRAAHRAHLRDGNAMWRLSSPTMLPLTASTASAFVTLADRVDSFLYGKRLPLLVTAACRGGDRSVVLHGRVCVVTTARDFRFRDARAGPARRAHRHVSRRRW